MFVAIATMLASCVKSSKYKITDSDGTIYRTDNYSINGNCVSFDVDCGCIKNEKQKLIVCGSYTIKVNE